MMDAKGWEEDQDGEVTDVRCGVMARRFERNQMG
jgi:hypothetical protein